MDRVTQNSSAAAPAGRTPVRRDDPAWREAERRLARYFQGFGVGDPRRLARLIEDALAGIPAHGVDDVADAAMRAAEARVGAWFVRVLGRDGADEPAAAALAGRAAFLLCDGPTRWPGAFLRRRPPRAFVAALRRAAVEATPAPEPCVMVPQELAFWSPADLVRPWLARPARLTVGLLPGLMHGRWLL